MIKSKYYLIECSDNTLTINRKHGDKFSFYCIRNSGFYEWMDYLNSETSMESIIADRIKTGLYKEVIMEADTLEEVKFAIGIME